MEASHEPRSDQPASSSFQPTARGRFGRPVGAPGSLDLSPVLPVADALCFEGYLLYPYRPSAMKNRVRWQFGVLAPRSWVEVSNRPEEGVAGSVESWWNRTELLVEGDPDAAIELVLRYLEPEHPSEAASSGALDQVGLRERRSRFLLGELEGRKRVLCWPREDETTPGGGDFEGNEPRADVPVRVIVTASPAGAPFRCHRLSVRVENADRSVPAGVGRAEALRRSLVGTHLVIGTDRASFLSLLEPPEWAKESARSCRNVRTFPVLAGPSGTDKLVLSAPIICYDHPQVAPESPGDLFDATEIDEILTLRTLTLTDAEKEEARASDPRAKALIDRVDAMPDEVFARLHGAVRSLERIPASGSPPASAGAQPGGSARPDGDTPPAVVFVRGVRIAAGSHVVCHPRPSGTDAQDRFFAGRNATVAEVLTDVDGRQFVAVTIDDDPRAELAAGPGRFRHLALDEIEPLKGEGGSVG